MKSSTSRAGIGRTSLILAISLISIATRAEGQASPYEVETTLSWERRVLVVRVSLDLQAAGLRLPAGRLEAERMVERDLAGLAKDAVFAISVDSRKSVGDSIADGTIDVSDLIDLASKARRTEAALTRSLRSFVAAYEFPLEEIGALYVRNSLPTAFPPVVEWAPSRPYTGIVIYAKGLLPVRGEGTGARLVPCLFPRVFDEGMELVLDRGRVDPEALRLRGELSYASDELASEDLIGDDPLRIAAVSVFGIGRTDLVLRREDALRIIASRENRELLRQGRVLVVLDLSPAGRATARP